MHPGSPTMKLETKDTAGSSNSGETPKTNMSFQLTRTTQAKLKESIGGLCCISSNPIGLARLEVTEKGFKIIVHNDTTGIAARLFLNPSELINFYCHQPVADVMICLLLVLNILRDAADKNAPSVDILHVAESDVLMFKYGKVRAPVNMLKITGEIQKFPDIKVSCKAVFTSKLLRKMIQRIIRKSINDGRENITGLYNYFFFFVPSYSKHTKVTAHVVGDKVLTHEFSGAEEIFGDRETTQGSTSVGVERSLKLHHLFAFNQVSALAPVFRISFLSTPPDVTMMKFNLRELGDLEILIPESET